LLAQRKPLHYLVGETLSWFFPTWAKTLEVHKPPISWLDSRFFKRHRDVLQRQQRRATGPPSFQENLYALDGVQRQLQCTLPATDPPLDLAYPYLDRDLLEFLFAIPRDQLVRPHQRRSLMRRALDGIVPDTILHRKRKAFVARGPMTAISVEWPRFQDLTGQMLSGALNILNPGALAQSLLRARAGAELPLAALTRALWLEYWLRHLVDWNLLPNSTPSVRPLAVAQKNTAAPGIPLYKERTFP